MLQRAWADGLAIIGPIGTANALAAKTLASNRSTYHPRDDTPCPCYTIRKRMSMLRMGCGREELIVRRPIDASIRLARSRIGSE